jgi:hypothetical protein
MIISSLCCKPKTKVVILTLALDLQLVLHD